MYNREKGERERVYIYNVYIGSGERELIIYVNIPGERERGKEVHYTYKYRGKGEYIRGREKGSKVDSENGKGSLRISRTYKYNVYIEVKRKTVGRYPA
jgi:hypothetical protein